MPLVTEEQALQALQFAGQTDDPTQKKRLGDLVAGYKAQQETAGQPMFPNRQKAELERRQKTRSYFQDREKHGLVDDDLKAVSQQFINDEEGKSAFFVDQFLAQEYQRPTDKIRPIRKQYRDEYSKARWGEPVKTDKEFYDKLGADFDTEDAINAWGQKSALLGLSPIEAYAQIPEEIANSESFKGREWEFRQQYERTARATDARLAPYRQVISSTVADLVEKTHSGLIGDDSKEGVKSFADLAQRLLEVPEQDREVVIKSIMASAPGGEEKSFPKKLGENFARGARDLGFGVIGNSERDLLLQIESEIISGRYDKRSGENPSELISDVRASILDSGAIIGTGSVAALTGSDNVELSEFQKSALEEVNKRHDALKLHNQIRRIADNDIDPATSEFKVIQGLYDASRSIPYTLTALAGPVGFVINSNALADEAYHRVKEMNPETSRKDAAVISNFAGPIAAYLERVSANVSVGKTPRLNALLNKAVLTQRSQLVRLGTRIGAVAATELVQENLQDATPYAIQSFLSTFNEEIPGTPWARVTAEQWKNQERIFFAVLPMAIIGGGGASIGDFKGAEAMVKDTNLLMAAGLTEAQAFEVKELADSGDMAATEKRMRAAFKEGGQDQEAIQATVSKAIQKVNADLVKSQETVAKAEQLGILPAVGRTGEGWTLRFQDGNTRTFDTHQEADQSRWQYASDNSIKVHESVRSVIQSVESQLERGREIEFTFTNERRSLLDERNEGGISTEQGIDRLDQAELLDNQDVSANSAEVSSKLAEADISTEYETAFTEAEMASLSEDDRLANSIILGSSQTKFAEGVERTTIKLYQGATPLTVIEEKLEGDADMMIKDGQRDWLVNAMRQYERVSGDKVFLSDKADADLTRGDIVEAWSHLGQSYFVGRSKKGDVGDRWKSKDFRSFAAKLLKSPLGGAFTGYANFFRAVWKRAATLNKLRREGKLDQDLEKALARSVGFGEQREYEQSVEELAKAQKREIESEMGFEGEPDTPSDFVPEEDGPSFSVIANADADYFAAVESGDMEAAQRMVDDAAKAAGYMNLYFHNTNNEFDTFKPSDSGKIGGGIYLSKTPRKKFGKRELKLYTKITNPLTVENAPEGFLEKVGNFILGIDAKKVAESDFDATILSDLEATVRNPNQVKSADPVTYDENGEVIPLSKRFDSSRNEITHSVITNPEIDAEYLTAVESGDMETAQRMVDEAAKKAGYDLELFHSGTFSINGDPIFDNQSHFGTLAAASERAENKGGVQNLTKVYANFNSPLRIDSDLGITGNDWETNLIIKSISDDQFSLSDILEMATLPNKSSQDEFFFNRLQENGYDSIVYRNKIEDPGKDSFINFNPNQIKSADPVTYDENGEVIPLSKRFDSSRDEITHSVITNAEQRVIDMFSPFQRDPDTRRKIALEAKRRAAEQGRKLQPILNANRTNKEIETERKEREADLIGDKLDTLSPSQIAALDTQASLDDFSTRPILSEILSRKSYKTKGGKTVSTWGGSLMSKSEAKRRGFKNLSEWEDMPDNLPPYVWGGTITPDQAADQFGFGSITEFWNALNSEIASYQALNQDAKDAQATIRELEKEAREESIEWAKQAKRERDTIGSDRATLIGYMRTLDAMISALPAEVRGKIGGFVKLAQFKTPESMMRELERRAEKMDRELEKWLKKEADEGVKKLFKKAVPAKDQAGKKRVGKAGVTAHDLFDTLRDVYKGKWNDERAESYALALEGEIAKGELSGEEEAHKIIEAELVRLFGNWSESDATKRNAALDAATEVWTKAYHDFQIKKAEERERRDVIRQSLKEDTGKEGVGSERDLAKETGAKPLSRSKEFMLSLLNFDQLVSWSFGENSRWAKWFADEQRSAENLKEDRVSEVLESVEDLFTGLAGSRFKGEQLQFRLAQPGAIKATDSTGDTRSLSELEGLTVLLMWQQEDGQRHMLGKRDEETGAITSKWSYNQSFVDQVSDQLSSDAWAVLEFLREQYGQEYEGLNEVYSDLHGVNLPHNANYSPLTMRPQQAQGGQTVDPVTGTTTSGGSMTPGSLRTRGGAVAEPEFRDALATFIAHKKQIEHWKAFARFSRDAQAILGNKDVGDSVTAKHGEEAVNLIRKWLDAIAQGGTRDAAAGVRFNEFFRKITGNAAAMALVGRIGTVAVQATQLGAAAAKMPVGAYTVRLSKLLTGNMPWVEAFNSPYIQRRLKEQPALVQQAMEGLRAGKPTQLKHQVRRIGRLIGGADALFTAGTYAMVYDYQLSQARKAGLEGIDAESIARQEADRITDEVAQPTRLGSRSFLEIASTHPFAKLAWSFGSESRKNLALMSYSLVNRPLADKGRAALYVVLLNGLMATVIRNAWRDARDGEDEEFLDEKHWSPGRMALAASTDWIFGFPVVGEEVQRLIYSAFGEWSPNGGLLSSIPDMAQAVDNLATGDSNDALRDFEKIMTAFGLFHDGTAAATSLMHLVRDTYGLGRNFFGR